MLKVLELFGGIGACTKALSRLGIDYEIVDYVEVDANAVKSYNALNGTAFTPQDVTKWDKDLSVDFIMHGSPCQDFSLCGKQAGGDENSGTRSSLMFETVRIIQKLRPKFVVWENVKNVLSGKHKHNLDKYCDYLKGLGYTSTYRVLNARDCGIPQNRERLFVVSVRNDLNKSFEFPTPVALNKTVVDFLERHIDAKFYLPSGSRCRFFVQAYETLAANACKDGDIVNAFNKTVVTNGICPTITTRPEGFKTAIVIVDGNRLRKITPRECWRLMGFDDSDFDKVCGMHSDAVLYHQAGNSIVVNVLEYLLKNLVV